MLPPYNPAYKCADLTEEQIIEILGLVLSGRNKVAVARQFDIPFTAVEDILAGKYAKHLRRGSPASILNAPMK